MKYEEGFTKRKVEKKMPKRGNGMFKNQNMKITGRNLKNGERTLENRL